MSSMQGDQPLGARTSFLDLLEREMPGVTPIPPRLVFSLPGGKHHVLLTMDAKVLRRHIDPAGLVDHAEKVIGQVKQNPANPSVWGVCNLTSTPWTAIAAGGRSVEVPPQKSVPLAVGMTVNIGGTMAEIVA